MKQGYTETQSAGEGIRIHVEKRIHDQKFLLVIDSPEKGRAVKVERVKDHNLVTGRFEAPLVEIDAVIASKDITVSEKIRVLYDLVDEFSFSSKMLYKKHFAEIDSCLVFQ